ncbi:adenylate/guanylate cyclase domain-containing protein [Micromonospora sp. WMMD1155]|uniref:adenylate/guanylate cyclase domain-containing protein n=1 Tax=Micromonospora sp. WMMD1155 TaxID=3016094 RepID=UPI00249A687A|nr:adenylate/guanylate cyclase domain-containing protein [Micromonospora sp. WMMD1155]WFE53978.1 adenylate/guanylate cyclase domain-containing protein [Micromonospora sp. WMMD1155]
MTSSIVVVDPRRTGTGHWPVPVERRIVTVLFADIVGSTGLVDRLDPEDVRALQRAYFDAVAGVLHRWQGVVEKYVGDAVMALFGARHSDGFDAYRAVRAGLEIQAALDRRPMVDDIKLRVRVGVATGEVVVDLGGAVSGGHGVASGAVITTAARLQEYAEPGAVALCAATAGATAGLITQRQLVAVPVASRVPPMPVWHAVGPVRPGTDRHDGPLIGRRRELATIRDQVSRAVREQSPRWLSLVGPTGSGRSRLLHELTRGLTTVDGRPVRWCVATCQPYPDQALAPAADLLRGLAGVRHGDGPAVVHDRLVAALTSLFPPERVAAAIPALQRFLTSPDSSSAALAGAAACRDVLLRLAAHQPLVVAVDDVDRAAPAMSRFLHALFTAATARGLPLALITLHQPQWADTRPSPARRMTIGPLATVQSGRLLRHLLTRAGQPVTLVDRLLPLVGGRPGHAAAYVASLVDGADPVALALPEALRRVVGAELDTLDGERRAVLMAAATLGGVICGDAVDRALGWPPGRSAPTLRALVAAGLLLPRRVGGYAFAAPALRQVAAERLPRALRAVFGRRVADVVDLDTVHPNVVRADVDRAGADPAGAGRAAASSKAVRRAEGVPRAEVVPLDAVRARNSRLGAAVARTNRLDAVFAMSPSDVSRHRPRSPTVTTSPAASTSGTDPRLRAVPSTGGVPPTRGSTRATHAGGQRAPGADRASPAIRVVPAVPGSAERTAPADVGSPPGVVRALPRPPATHWGDGLAASA